MKDNPLILSIFIGIIVVLSILSISFFVKMKALTTTHQEEIMNRMNLQKAVEELKTENYSLKEENDKLKTAMAALVGQIENLKKDIINLENSKREMVSNLKVELNKYQTAEKKIEEKIAKDTASIKTTQETVITENKGK